MIETLIEEFDYDAWANRLWASALNALDPKILDPQNLNRANSPGPWPDFFIGEATVRAGDVFSHILFANRIWLERCGIKIHHADADAEVWIASLQEGWRTRLDGARLDEPITYTNSSGHTLVRPFGQIARHTINHGTYHRGQLREIAEYLSLDEIPTTDLIFFLFLQDED